MAIYFFKEHEEKPFVKITTPFLPGIEVRNGYTEDIVNELHGIELERLGGVLVEAKRKPAPKKRKVKKDGK